MYSILIIRNTITKKQIGITEENYVSAREVTRSRNFLCHEKSQIKHQHGQVYQLSTWLTWREAVLSEIDLVKWAATVRTSTSYTVTVYSGQTNYLRSTRNAVMLVDYRRARE